MSVLASVAFVVDAVEPVFVRLLFHLPLMSGVLGFKNVVVRVGAKLYDEPVDSTEDDDDVDNDDNNNDDDDDDNNDDDDDGVGVGGGDHGDEEGNSDGDVGIVCGISVKK